VARHGADVDATQLDGAIPRELQQDTFFSAALVIGFYLAVHGNLAGDRPVLVAHDIGTAVAQLMAAHAPERIRGLVLIDGVYADQWAMEEVESIRRWELSAAARLPKLLVRRVGSWTERTESQELLRKMIAADEGAIAGVRIIRAANSMDPRSTVEILEQLRRRHPPSLILWGRSDRFLSLDGVARPLADLLDAELKVLPGGHFLPLDCPERVAAEIEAFVRTLQRQ